MENFPKITVDQKVVIGLAILALVVSYAVYRENKRLRNDLEQVSDNRVVKKTPCSCQEQFTVTEHSAEGLYKEVASNDVEPPTVVVD